MRDQRALTAPPRWRDTDRAPRGWGRAAGSAAEIHLVADLHLVLLIGDAHDPQVRHITIYHSAPSERTRVSRPRATGRCGIPARRRLPPSRAALAARKTLRRLLGRRKGRTVGEHVLRQRGRDECEEKKCKRRTGHEVFVARLCGGDLTLATASTFRRRKAQGRHDRNASSKRPGLFPNS